MKFFAYRAVPALAIAGAMLFAGLAFAQAGGSGYHLLHTYPFAAAPGSTGEYFDYVNVDSAARRVYLSRGTAVQVIDADSGASLGFVPGFTRQHGVAIAAEFNRGFVSDGGSNANPAKITIFDLKTLKTIADVKSDPDTDGIVYDPASKLVFSMNGDSHNSTVVNAQTGEVVKKIDLGGAPEFAVSDGKGMVYANIADKNEIVAIDTKALEVKSRWPTAPEGGPTALAIDREHRRLFSAGRNPQVLAILDADTGKVIQSFPITAGTDAAAYDPATGMIFVSTTEGKIHVFHEDSPDKYSAVDTIDSQYGAKTMSLDTKTHNLFLDTADFAAPAAAAANGRGGRRMPVPGSYHVLVYGK